MPAVLAPASPPAVQRHSMRARLLAYLPFALFAFAWLLLPRFAEGRHITLLIYIGINVLLALGLNLLMGYAGQISLGHAAFYGLGAYTSAILTAKPMPAEAAAGVAVGLGVMAGAALVISLTRISGARLVAALSGLIGLTWLAARTGGMAGTAILIVGMAGVGFAARFGWKQAALSGALCALTAFGTGRFLLGATAQGHISPWTGMIAGMLLTGLVAYLIGCQVLRLRGHYLAMATLGFGVIVEIVFRQWTAVTGGSSDGIYSIPTITLPGPVSAALKGLVGSETTPQQEYYFLVWAFVFAALILAVNIVHSRVGRAFRAMHSSERAVESLGVDTERYKVHVFVFSAALASIAGSLHAHNAGVGYINPGEFSFMVSVQLVVMVVIGGMASVWGSLVGAGSIEILRHAILNIEKSRVEPFGLSLKGLEPVVFGGVLIAVMMLMPQGLVRGLTDAAAVSLKAAMRPGAKGKESAGGHPD